MAVTYARRSCWKELEGSVAVAERGLVSCLPSLGAPARRMVQSNPALVHAAEILQQVPRWLNFLSRKDTAPKNLQGGALGC